MRFSFKKLSKVKKALILALIFTSLAIAGLFYLINFTQILVNIPLGSRFAQINIADKNLNIFIPKDDTTWLYFRNFNLPQIITQADTTLKNLGNQSNTKPQQKDVPPVQIKPVQKTEPRKISGKYLKSKILNLTFTTPEGVESSYWAVRGGLMEEEIEFKKGYRMTIRITKNNTICQETSKNNQSFSESWFSSIMLADKIELIFPPDLGKRGWSGSRAVKFFPDTKTCLEVYKEEHNSIGNTFDQILTSAKFE